ncbi:MAG: FAD-dependent monooxygenase [Burkholderiaceae bacterium]|nr:FAD-dependent monooxygenase [Burkholderiaceae bacterium]
MARTHDVIIIGAGPAGTATAACLWGHGVRDLLVLDRAHFPRDKPCGGGLTGHAGAALEALGLRLEVPRVPARSAQIRFAGFERPLELPRPVDVVRRVEFDASLLAQVRARGVPVRTGVRVTALALESRAVSLRLDSNETLSARVVVGADGVASVVRKHLGATVHAAPHRLFVQELAVPSAPAVMTYDFTPMLDGVRGSLWIFAVPGERINVGLMHYPSLSRQGADLRHVLRARLRSHGIALPQRGLRGWPIWGYDPRAPLAGQRLLTVGDAAGVDALTGEGIAVALEQARLAGAAVRQALLDGDFRFRDYACALRRATVGRELALDRWLAGRLYQPGPAWQFWLALMLFEPELAESYAARVAGTAVLADHKLRIGALIARHWARRRERHRQLHHLLDEAAPCQVPTASWHPPAWRRRA